MKLFAGGLRNTKEHANKLVYGARANGRNYHDWMSYERGSVSHARSVNTQYQNFHHSYGGWSKWIFERYWKNVIWRRIGRVAQFPCGAYYIFGAVTMRMYDNGAYDYFYFSD